jgi:hypothetical protein
MTSRFVYDIDRSRSTWRLCVDGKEALDYAARELAGDFTFNPAEATACRIQLHTAVTSRTADDRVPENQCENLGSSNSNGALKIRFLSWRFRELGRRKYWVAGALTLGDLTRVASLRIDGPSPEITDRNGHVRAGAAATVTIDESLDRLVLDYFKTSATPLTLSFQIELVRRFPEKRKAAAA